MREQPSKPRAKVSPENVMCLCGVSAPQYWTHVRRLHGNTECPELGTSASRRAHTRTATRALAQHTHPRLADAPPAACTLPLQAIVIDKQAETATAHVRARATTLSLPAGCFAHISGSVFASTPEFAFTQMANKLTFYQLIALGFELCGTYASDAYGHPASNAFPLSSAARLTAFVDRAAGFRHRPMALRALAHILDGSASPRETHVAMMLSLPYRYGGYGFPKPIMNQTVRLPRGTNNTGGHLVCDLYWPQWKLDLEYDSNEHHAGEDRIGKDAQRRARLESIGITSINVSNSQVKSGEKFNQLAHSLAKITGKRLRYKDPAFTRAHLKLREELHINGLQG